MCWCESKLAPVLTQHLHAHLFGVKPPFGPFHTKTCCFALANAHCFFLAVQKQCVLTNAASTTQVFHRSMEANAASLGVKLPFDPVTKTLDLHPSNSVQCSFILLHTNLFARGIHIDPFITAAFYCRDGGCCFYMVREAEES